MPAHFRRENVDAIILAPTSTDGGEVRDAVEHRAPPGMALAAPTVYAYPYARRAVKEAR
ncbi:MAG: hypothetical protein HY271_07950 [Deltaproteobacteria bacterium]|nr:hypothetical protein [Deltaproteobacteria bacterium]